MKIAPCSSLLVCVEDADLYIATRTRSLICEPGGGGTGKRKKRQAGFKQKGGKGSKQEYSSQAQVDFDTEANFMHQFMKVPQRYRCYKHNSY